MADVVNGLAGDGMAGATTLFAGDFGSLIVWGVIMLIVVMALGAFAKIKGYL